MQKLDPRVKLVFTALGLVLVSIKHSVPPQFGMGVFVALLMVVSRLDLLPLLRRAVAAGLLFGVLVPLPSILNIVTQGEIILPLVQLEHDFRLWGLHLPARIGVTREGLMGLILLTLRITNSVALSLLILHTTSFPGLMKALRVFRVPDSFITIITLSYKYLLAFTRTVQEMHLAKKSRLAHSLDAGEARSWSAGRIAFLFHRTQSRCDEIFKAMISRGFEHDSPLQSFKPLTANDGVSALAATVILSGLLLW